MIINNIMFLIINDDSSITDSTNSRATRNVPTMLMLPRPARSHLIPSSYHLHIIFSPCRFFNILQFVLQPSRAAAAAAQSINQIREITQIRNDAAACVKYRAANDPSVFTITEKAPTRAFSWLKAYSSSFTL